jgi:LysR family glycine cleavage system transcriptional activator
VNVGGTLEIELESAFNSDWLTPRLQSFTRICPDARIDLNISPQKRLEFRGGTQVAIKWGRPPWRGYQADWLMGSRMTPVCAPGLLREQSLNQPGDVLGFRLLHDKDESAWRMWAKLAGLKRFVAGAGHVFQDTLALKQAAMRGHGIALYGKELIENELEDGVLVAPFPAIEVTEAGAYYLITRRKKLEPLAVEFIRWLKTEVQAPSIDV